MLPQGETGCVLLEILRDLRIVENNKQTRQPKDWKQKVPKICVGTKPESKETEVKSCFQDTMWVYLENCISRRSKSMNDENYFILKSSEASFLGMPRSRLIYIGERPFPVRALRLWNELPEEVRAVNSVSSFKSLLKTHV